MTNRKLVIFHNKSQVQKCARIKGDKYAKERSKEAAIVHVDGSNDGYAATGRRKDERQGGRGTDYKGIYPVCIS